MSRSTRNDAPTGADASPTRPPTRWGDREQRRVDILDAARARIEGGGYLSLNMRDLAAAAGLSPATLYSYFATKEELFVTLYVEAIRRHTADIRPGCDESTGLVELLEHVLRGYLDLYRAYGRYFTLWSALRADVDPERGPFPRELIVELRTVSLEHSRLVARAVRRTAAAEGLKVVGGEVGAAYLWSTLNGIADHLTSERSALDNFDSERLIPFGAQRLARALTDPA
jgi:AcrR family transcriptional regulator